MAADENRVSSEIEDLTPEAAKPNQPLFVDITGQLPEGYAIMILGGEPEHRAPSQAPGLAEEKEE